MCYFRTVGRWGLLCFVAQLMLVLFDEALVSCLAQVQQLEERLAELEEERKELAKFQQIDKQRRSLEFAIYDKELADTRAKLDQVVPSFLSELCFSHTACLLCLDLAVLKCHGIMCMPCMLLITMLS